MADIAFDPFSLLDPARERLQVEAVNGPTFTNFSALDDALMRRQVEATAGAGTIFSPFSHDPALAEQQMAAKVHGHGYKAKAVHFDATMSTPPQIFSLAMSGVMDSSQGLWSLWLKTIQGTDPSGPTNPIWIAPADNSGSDLLVINQRATPAGSPEIYLQDEADNNDIGIYGVQNIADGSWHNIICAVDTNFPIGSRKMQFVVDGALLSTTTLFEDGDVFLFDISHGCGIGVAYSSPQTTRGTFDIAEAQLWVGISPDMSQPSNIAKFIHGGKPVNPNIAVSAFGQQTVLFSGDHTTFPTNQGTGGAFILTGALTDASSSPSD